MALSPSQIVKLGYHILDYSFLIHNGFNAVSFTTGLNDPPLEIGGPPGLKTMIVCRASCTLTISFRLFIYVGDTTGIGNVIFTVTDLNGVAIGDANKLIPINGIRVWNEASSGVPIITVKENTGAIVKIEYQTTGNIPPSYYLYIRNDSYLSVTANSANTYQGINQT